MIPSWLILLFSIECGMIPDGAVYNFDSNSGDGLTTPLYTTLSTEGRIGPAFIRGSVETDFYWDSGGRPFDATYAIGAGFRFSIFEIGWSHFCAHPVVSGNGPIDNYYQRFIGTCDRYYIRAEVKINE